MTAEWLDRVKQRWEDCDCTEDDANLAIYAIPALLAYINKLREALEEYENQDNWCGEWNSVKCEFSNGCKEWNHQGDIYDGTQIAREALLYDPTKEVI